MNFGLSEALTLLGSLGFFIYGMKIMSESIQKVAGSKMRQFLSSMTSNRAKGVFTGFLITSLIQSSSATTVLVVSFVNAGLLSLLEAIGVIMGANIGTTITAWLISIVGFKVKIASYALPIIAIGFPMIFVNRDKVKSWGEVLIGFALLFMGLDFLKASVPDLGENPELLAFLRNYTDLGFLSTVIFIGIGTILTIVVQSSSASMALTLVMANNGWIPFEIAAAMVLGENIGTTITANIAALVANVHAKRAAIAHLFFNIFGIAWIVILLQPVLRLIDFYLVNYQDSSPLLDFTAIPIALSIFHTTFNVLNTVLLVWFAPFIARIATRVIKAEGDEDYKLEYLSTGVMNTAELSLEEAQKEASRFGEVTVKMAELFRSLLLSKKDKKQKKLLSKIRKYEEITDQIEEEIAKYLSKVADGTLSSSASSKIVSILSITNDLERVGDIFFQMSKDIERRIAGELNFSKAQVDSLEKMLDLLDESQRVMISNLNSDYSKVQLDIAIEVEEKINTLRDKLREEHVAEMEKKEYKAKTGALYKDLFHSCEKIGDHIINVSEAICRKTARQLKKDHDPDD